MLDSKLNRTFFNENFGQWGKGDLFFVFNISSIFFEKSEVICIIISFHGKKNFTITSLGSFFTEWVSDERTQS